MYDVRSNRGIHPLPHPVNNIDYIIRPHIALNADRTIIANRKMGRKHQNMRLAARARYSSSADNMLGCAVTTVKISFRSHAVLLLVKFYHRILYGCCRQVQCI